MEGGKVECILQADSPHSLVIVTVNDEGIGILRSEIDKIFTPFYQMKVLIHASLVGLDWDWRSLKSWLSLHGGSINVESVAGTGSTFYYNLKAKYFGVIRRMRGMSLFRSRV